MAVSERRQTRFREMKKNYHRSKISFEFLSPVEKRGAPMSNDTLTAGLESYEIGPKIHRLRKQKGLSLAKLGEHTGMSAGLLSKIERGRLVPTLPTLLKIAMVFGAGLDHFFSDDKDRPVVAVVKKKDRLRLPNRSDGEAPSYFFECLDFPVTDRKMDAYFVEFRPRAKPAEPHQHPGAEVIYVIGGELVVTIDGEETPLREGDSMYFDSSYPHSYRQCGRRKCSAVVVVTS
jgi:transcriptional regulator with XRE-family HTH domain